MAAEIYTYINGFIAGLSIACIIYPISYHRGWVDGFERKREIWK